MTDIDKVVLGLKAKDFTVEKSTLQSLQQLMQWVADLALTILAKLPENRNHGAQQRNSGVSITDLTSSISKFGNSRVLIIYQNNYSNHLPPLPLRSTKSARTLSR